MSRFGHYNRNGAAYDKRDVFCAAKDIECFAGCEVLIPKGEFYIQDKRQEGNGNFTETKMTLAWHLEHAPRNKSEMSACLTAAIEDHAKHPTRLGAE